MEHLGAGCGMAPTCGWMMFRRTDFLEVVLDMTIGSCMCSKLQWVSRYTQSTWIVLDHLESQTPAGQIAKGLCSAVAGKPQCMAYQTSARHEEDIRGCHSYRQASVFIQMEMKIGQTRL